MATGNVHAHSAARVPLQDAFVGKPPPPHAGVERAAAPPQRLARARLPRGDGRPLRRPPAGGGRERALAEQLDFDLTGDLGYRYPGVEDQAAQRRLAELCGERLHERYTGMGLREARARLEQELAVIETLSLAGFFLLHHEILELSREVAAEVRGAGSARALLPPGRGRGSSVSSIVCYLTGLSHIDPLAGGLAMGRFLNPELTSLPDIDIDFPRDVREVLIRRVHERYGHDRAALVATFPSFRARGAIRELGKALGLPPGEIERVARGADVFGAHRSSGRAVERDLAGALGTRAQGARWVWLARLAQEALGLPRHISQHPGGMIVATRPLIDCCPVVPAAMEGRQLVQWDKDSCADAGFLKIDLLGLGMLSAVERAVELIARTRGERIDLSRIPFDDPATFAAIAAAETTGVFQIESRAQMQSLRRTRPENLAELAVQVAIIRPGPIQGGAVNPYIERRQRLREDPDYEPPSLHPSLAGRAARDARHDHLPGPGARGRAGLCRLRSRRGRRAAPSDEPQACERRDRALPTAASSRAPPPTSARRQELAQRVWEMVAGFAGFGFPKAHSAAFGLLAYQSTWLRVHYGPEFLCALLNEQPMGFYPPDSLVHEAQRRGIALRAVDINASLAECSVEAPPGGEGGGAVRIGLGYVRGVHAEEVAALVRAREEGGPFGSVAELAARVPAARASLEQLAWSGACDALAGERRRALWDLGVATPGRRVPGGTQLALALDAGDAPALRGLGRWETLLADYATSGITLNDHALAILRPRLAAVTTSAQLSETRHGAQVTVAGLVVARQRPETASGVVFMLLEDEHGPVNLIVPPALYERRRHLVRAEPLILAHGRLERPPAGGGTINVLVRDLRTLDEELAGIAAAPIAHLPAREVGSPAEPVEREGRGGRLSRRRTARPELRRWAAALDAWRRQRALHRLGRRAVRPAVERGRRRAATAPAARSSSPPTSRRRRRTGASRRSAGSPP